MTWGCVLPSRSLKTQHHIVFTSQSLSDFKDKLVRQGNQYIAEAALYSEKIAGFTDGFVKDGSVV